MLSSQTLGQWIFSQWAIKELFIDENDSVREWWFRSWLDRYVSVFLSLVVLHSAGLINNSLWCLRLRLRSSANIPTTK